MALFQQWNVSLANSENMSLFQDDAVVDRTGPEMIFVFLLEQQFSDTASYAQVGGVTLYETWKLLSHVRFFVTPWIVAHQAPLFMEFSRQGVGISYYRGSSQPRDWTWVPAFQVDSLLSEPPEKPTDLLAYYKAAS